MIKKVKQNTNDTKTKNKISDKAKLLYIGLWTIADDYGVLENDPPKIRAQIFPYKSRLKIEGYLKELVDIKKITPYEVEGKGYFWIKNFLKYQWLSHPKKQFPQLPAITGNIQKLLANRIEEKGKEIEIEKKPSSSNNPYYKKTGEEMRYSKGKFWVLPKDGGKWLEFNDKESEIEYK